MFVLYQNTRRTMVLMLIGLLLITTGHVLANDTNTLTATDSPAISFSQVLVSPDVMNMDALTSRLQQQMAASQTINIIPTTPRVKGDPATMPIAYPIKPPPPMPVG